MAAGRLPAPGTEFGPCETCDHIDCRATREQARSVCRFCDGSIGYENRFYTDEDLSEPGRRVLVHADCMEDSIKEERISDGHS